MRSAILFIAAFFTITLVGFKTENTIGKCFISFTNAMGLTAAVPDHLPETADKTRALNTENGDVAVTILDGYRILYNNSHDVPFVNLKVELSAANTYEADQKKLIDNLTFLNAHSNGMETKKLIQLEFNGYKIWGVSRGSIDVGNTLGTFIMFPGKGITVYFYFNNLKPGMRNFESLEDYKKQRDKFMEDYIKHLINCKE